MPGKTANFEIPYALDADSPPSVPTITKSMADRLEELHGAIDLSSLVVPGGEADDGKIAIVENGEVKLKAVSGDATISEAGSLQLGSKVVGNAELGDKAVSTGKIDDGAVTSAKLAPTVGRKSATEGVTANGTFQDIPGCSLSITPTVASNLVVVMFGYVNPLAGSEEAAFSMKVDGGEDLTPRATIRQQASTIVGTSQGLVISLSAAAHTVKMRASLPAGETALDVGRTGFLYALFAS